VKCCSHRKSRAPRTSEIHPRREPGATIGSRRHYAARRCDNRRFSLAASSRAASSRSNAQDAVPASCRTLPAVNSIPRLRARLSAGSTTIPQIC
jgi:hypothetical protein